MSRSRILLLLTLVVVLSSLTGCARLMGSLRRDLDDGDAQESPPTIGGRWAERGFLSEDMPEGGSTANRYVGHSDRNPASGSASGGPASRSWVSPARADANRREMGRGPEEEGPNSANSSTMEPNVRRQYKNGSRATRSDFVDESQNEGSLWASDGQTNYYFTKNKIRGVGDILTINVEDSLLRDVGMEARRSLTARERSFELDAAQERLRLKAQGAVAPEEKTKDKVASSAAGPNRGPATAEPPAPAPDVEVPQATYADVDVSKSLELKAGDTMMGEIIERYPNGNYKIRATKKVPYKGGVPRFVSLVGVVKGTDIAEDDTVASGKLYEYRVEASR